MITPYGKNSIRRNLYDLKKTWGVQVDWFRLLGSAFNVETGKMVTNWEKFSIRRGILLPSQLDRTAMYSLSYLAANKNFVYGGLFDTDNRMLIIDVRDLPRTFQIDASQPEFNDKIIAEHKRYQLKRVFDFDHSLAWLLHITYVKNSEPEDNEFTVSVNQTLEVSDEAVPS